MMPLPSARIFSATSRAVSIPPALGVSTISAPKARMVWRRSSERCSGITSTILYQRIAGRDRTPPFCLENHRQSGTILDRSGGVVALELRQQHVVRLAGQALQPHERRIPDGVFDGLIHGAHYAFKKFYCTANKIP